MSSANAFKLESLRIFPFGKEGTLGRKNNACQRLQGIMKMKRLNALKF